MLLKSRDYLEECLKANPGKDQDTLKKNNIR